MMYFKVVSGKIVEVATKFTATQDDDRAWKSRHDIANFQDAERIAAEITQLTGRMHLGTDAGDGVWPRFDVIEAPQVGDKVSYSFNGDTYPDGEIVKISNKWQVTTSTGNKYRRRKNSAGWLRTGGTWSMVAGHHYEQNPHF